MATELWLVDLDRTEGALETLEAATPRLSIDVQERIDRMADTATRRERRLAHIALRILLEARLGPGIRVTPFIRTPQDKPLLAGCETAFSLSHTRGLALIALADRDPLGVDIEVARPVRMPTHRRAPIEAEAIALAGGAPLDGAGPDARFLRAWVRLEAAAKAQGRGIGALLEPLRPSRAAAMAASAAAPKKNSPPSVIVHDVPTERNVYAALALAAGVSPPPLRHLPDTAAGLDGLLLAKQGTRR
ncbi:hypothetical protein [Hyphomicrobium sp. CS1GBMeth3]|uniref:4'-phosphopantetheinyl transferase family protein n=1 Tax=Hyphomicrobium sp. CS1GBMeth3 TaxID=1892845 RepID=UPI000930DB16|nr:hypothetical protein [Hyphomicrobium sp. CS1GBMeth3]